MMNKTNKKKKKTNEINIYRTSGSEIKNDGKIKKSCCGEKLNKIY